MDVYIEVIPALLCIIVDVDDVTGSRSTLRSWGHGMKEENIICLLVFSTNFTACNNSCSNRRSSASKWAKENNYSVLHLKQNASERIIASLFFQL